MTKEQHNAIDCISYGLIDESNIGNCESNVTEFRGGFLWFSHWATLEMFSQCSGIEMNELKQVKQIS